MYIMSLTLEEILFLLRNLMIKNFKFIFNSCKVILTKKNAFVGKRYAKDNMYVFNINKIYGDSAYFVDFFSGSLWHHRLGYISMNALIRLCSHAIFPKSSNVLSTKTCEYCAQAKITKPPSKRVFKTNDLLELIHSDL